MWGQNIWRLLALAGMLCAASAAHADTEAADSRAVILHNLSFIKTADLEFGGILASNQQGFVTLAPDGTRTTTNGIIAVGSFRQPARFAGDGTQNQTVLISITSNTINITGPGAAMRVDQFVIGSTPTANITTTPTRFRITSPTGTFEFPIGARLRVNANQAPGRYTGTFTITLNYE